MTKSRRNGSYTPIDEIICKGFEVIVTVGQEIYAINNCRLNDYISPITGEIITFDRLTCSELYRLELWKDVYNSIGLILSERVTNNKTTTIVEYYR